MAATVAISRNTGAATVSGPWVMDTDALMLARAGDQQSTWPGGGAQAQQWKLVRGHFELVFTHGRLGAVLEGVAVHAGELMGFLVSGSDTWGRWLFRQVGAAKRGMRLRNLDGNIRI